LQQTCEQSFFLIKIYTTKASSISARYAMLISS